MVNILTQRCQLRQKCQIWYTKLYPIRLYGAADKLVIDNVYVDEKYDQKLQNLLFVTITKIGYLK